MDMDGAIVEIDGALDGDTEGAQDGNCVFDVSVGTTDARDGRGDGINVEINVDGGEDVCAGEMVGADVGEDDEGLKDGVKVGKFEGE